MRPSGSFWVILSPCNFFDGQHAASVCVRPSVGLISAIPMLQGARPHRRSRALSVGEGWAEAHFALVGRRGFCVSVGAGHRIGPIGGLAMRPRRSVLRGSEGGRIAASDIRRAQPKITGKIDRQLVRAEQQNGLGVDAETYWTSMRHSRPKPLPKLLRLVTSRASLGSANKIRHFLNRPFIGSNMGPI